MSGKWDSILMWSHYGDFHRGFCIGFNEFKMRKSGLFGTGGPVMYSDIFPEIDPLLDDQTMRTSFNEFYHKAKDWEYEEEYRLTCLFFPNSPTNEERIKKIQEEFIEEINLGMSISKIHKEEIIA